MSDMRAVFPIDRDALQDAVFSYLVEMGIDAWDVVQPIRRIIQDAPTLDYAPVRRGEFERQPEEYIVGLHVNPVLCKTCDTTYFTINKDGKRTICCPYCGARMKDDGKDDGKDDA